MGAVRQVTVKVDAKGRVTLPKEMRRALGVDAGDVLFVKVEPETQQVRLARALNPFDVLAEAAVEDHRNGLTRSVKDFAREHKIDL